MNTESVESIVNCKLANLFLLMNCISSLHTYTFLKMQKKKDPSS